MNTIEQIHNKLKEMLLEFHNFCVENDLTYYMLGGTQLGAVRHKGFIPWDDDADIGMPREDYERFLALKDKLINIEAVDNLRRKDGFTYWFTKIYNPNTTIVEKITNEFQIVGGVNIDVFPLDGMGNNEKLAYKQYKKIYVLKNVYNIKLIKIYSKNIKNNIAGHILNFVLPKKYVINKLQELPSKISFYDSDYIVNCFGAWGAKELVPKKYFGKPTLYDFEGIKLYGVENYDLYLKSLYGDYMELPPVEKRHTHPYAYINLDLPYKDYKGDNK